MEKLNTFKNQYTDPIAMRQGTGVFGKINPTNQTASYSPDKRIYNDWIIQDYLDRGIIAPGELRDIGKPGYKQVVPKLMGQQLAMNKGLDNWGGHGEYDGTFRREGYGDPNYLNRWGGYYTPEYSYDTYDDKVLDPGFGDHAVGPLYFG